MTDFTTSSASLNWTKPARGQSFKVQWTHGNNNWTENTTALSHTIHGLTPGVQYNVTVSAVAADGRTEGEGQTVSLHTSEISGFCCRREIHVFKGVFIRLICCFLTFTPGPGKVTQHSVNTRIDSISLNWAAPGSVAEYWLKWSSGEATSSMRTGTTSAVLSNLLPGTNYTITITAVVGENVTGEPYALSAVTSNRLFC